MRILTQDDEEDQLTFCPQKELGDIMRYHASPTSVDEGQTKMEGARQTQTSLSLATTTAAARVQMGTMDGTSPPDADANAGKSVTASLRFFPDGLQTPESSGPQASIVLRLDADTEARQAVFDSVTASLEFEVFTESSTPVSSREVSTDRSEAQPSQSEASAFTARESGRWRSRLETDFLQYYDARPPPHSIPEDESPGRFARAVAVEQ